MFSLKAYRIKISFGRGPRTPTKFTRKTSFKGILVNSRNLKCNMFGEPLWNQSFNLGSVLKSVKPILEKTVSHVSPQTLWFCLLQLSHQLGSPLCMFNFAPKLGCAGWSKVMHMNYKARIKMLWVVCFNKTLWGWHWFSSGFPQWALSFKMLQDFF